MTILTRLQSIVIIADRAKTLFFILSRLRLSVISGLGLWTRFATRLSSSTALFTRVMTRLTGPCSVVEEAVQTRTFSCVCAYLFYSILAWSSTLLTGRIARSCTVLTTVMARSADCRIPVVVEPFWAGATVLLVDLGYSVCCDLLLLLLRILKKRGTSSTPRRSWPAARLTRVVALLANLLRLPAVCITKRVVTETGSCVQNLLLLIIVLHNNRSGFAEYPVCLRVIRTGSAAVVVAVLYAGSTGVVARLANSALAVVKKPLCLALASRWTLNPLRQRRVWTLCAVVARLLTSCTEVRASSAFLFSTYLEKSSLTRTASEILIFREIVSEGLCLTWTSCAAIGWTCT